jgi:hypothetical protein
MCAADLETKLLALGGEKVLLTPELDADALLARGRDFPATGTRRLPGDGHYAAFHAAAHYARHHRLGRGGPCHLVRGYGLCGGLWCCHCWLWAGGHVLDANDAYRAYYGMVLTPDEAANFVTAQMVLALPEAA